MNWILPPSKLMNSGLPNDVRLARAKRENELKDILADTSSFKVHYNNSVEFLIWVISTRKIKVLLSVLMANNFSLDPRCWDFLILESFALIRWVWKWFIETWEIFYYRTWNCGNIIWAGRKYLSRTSKL